MKRKSVILRQQAEQDVDDVISYYLSQTAGQAALGFIDAIERAYDHLASYPESGAPRHAHELNIPGIRFWPIQSYPYLIFYMDRADYVDVWRVLHAERDIPNWMQEI